MTSTCHASRASGHVCSVGFRSLVLLIGSSLGVCAGRFSVRSKPRGRFTRGSWPSLLVLLYGMILSFRTYHPRVVSSFGIPPQHLSTLHLHDTSVSRFPSLPLLLISIRLSRPSPHLFHLFVPSGRSIAPSATDAQPRHHVLQVSHLSTPRHCHQAVTDQGTD